MRDSQPTQVLRPRPSARRQEVPANGCVAAAFLVGAADLSSVCARVLYFTRITCLLAHTTRFQASAAPTALTFLRRARTLASTRDMCERVTQVKSGYAKALFLKMVISCTENIVHVSNSNAQMRPPAAGGGEERDGPDLAARLILTAACARDRLLAAPRPELRSS